MKFWFAVLSIFTSYLLFRRPQSQEQSFGTINVERINVRDKNGVLRAALSNSAGFTEGDRAGGTPIAGLMLYNEEGQETGGYLARGKAVPGGQNSAVTLTMDQFRQDENITMDHSEYKDDKGSKILDGITVSARPDYTKVRDEFALYGKFKEMPRPEARAARLKAAQEGKVMTSRAFLGVVRGLQDGKKFDKTGLFIKNQWGQDAIRIYVDSDNTPHLEVLDKYGKVIRYALKLAPESP